MINAIQTDISIVRQKASITHNAVEARFGSTAQENKGSNVAHDPVVFSGERVKNAIDHKVSELFRIFPNGGVEPEYQNLGLDIVV